MNYGTVINDVITAPLTMCSNFNGVGAWHTLTDEERAAYGWYLCEMVNESYNSFRQVRSELPALAFDGEKITAAYTITDKSQDTIRAEVLASLAEYRFAFEVGGLQHDGLTVRTDRESQSQLNIAYSTLLNGLIPDTDWKAVDTWQRVNLEQLEPIAKAVAAHTRGCFRGEFTVQALISTAQTIDELEAIHIADLFHEAYQAAVDEVMNP
jgi:hypothetical protein